MLDIGWPELLVVAIVLILVVGPKDLPPMLRAFGKTAKKYRGMATDFKNQFNEALEESELDELRQVASDVKGLNPMEKLKDAVNPLKEMGDDIKSHLDVADKDLTPVKPWKPKPEEISDVARSVGKKEKATKATAAAKAKSKTTSARAGVAKKAAAVKPKTTTSAAKTTASGSKTVRKPTAAATKPTSKPLAVKKPAAKPTAAKTATAKTAPRKTAKAPAASAKSSNTKSDNT